MSSSVGKKFSLTHLYNQLEKYEQTLGSAKESRLKKEYSTSSLHRTQSKKNAYPPNPTLSKFEKHYQASHNKSRLNKGVTPHHDHSLKIEDRWEERGTVSRLTVADHSPKTNSHFKAHQSFKPVLENKQNRVFSKKDELFFLNECNNLYGTDCSSPEADTVKKLLTEINKRDQIYEHVTRKFGSENVLSKLNHFFKELQLMKSIVNEFKRMSKLGIQDYEELYHFLKSQTEIIEEEEKQPRQE